MADMRLPLLLLGAFLVDCVAGQYDFGIGRSGESRGSLTPEAIAAITIFVIGVAIGLGTTIFFCYFVKKRADRAHGASYGDLRTGPRGNF